MPEFVKKDHDYSAVESYLQNNDVNITNNLNVDGNISGKVPLRDYIINGSFKYWLDNNGLSAETGLRYTATLALAYSLGNTISVTKNNTTPGQTLVPTNSSYYANFTTTDSTTNPSDISICLIRLENVSIYSNKIQTFSIWASSLSGTPKISVEASQFFGTGGSSTVLGISVSTITLSTSIKRYDITINWPSIEGKTLGSIATSYGQIYIWFSAGSDYNARTNSLGHKASSINIYKFQLIDGPKYVYIPERSETEELSLIGRYFKNFNYTGNIAVGRFCAVATTTNILTCTVPFFPHMRIAPYTLVYNNGVVGQVRSTSTGDVIALGTYIVDVFSESLSFFYCTSAPFTVGQSYDFDLTFDARF